MIAINDVPMSCINQAAIQYSVPASLIISVLKAENGHKNSATANKNGTYDYGPMQINTAWLKTLARYGYTVDDLRYNACLNVNAGTWILAKALLSNKLLWQGIGNYHSYSLLQNKMYRIKVNDLYQAIENKIAS